MKRVLPILAAVGAFAIALPAAAQNWLPINTRQEILDTRIDSGVRQGTLTEREAAGLRLQFRDIANLEARYRATNGLSEAERRDLDARFDRLSASIRIQSADNDRRSDRGYDRRDDRRSDRGYDRAAPWQSIGLREAMLDRRIDQGVRNGSLSRREAARLRGEFQTIASLENRYRANGLQNWERQDLDARFDRLSAQIRAERADNEGRRDRGYGYDAGARR